MTAAFLFSSPHFVLASTEAFPTRFAFVGTFFDFWARVGGFIKQDGFFRVKGKLINGGVDVSPARVTIKIRAIDN